MFIFLKILILLVFVIIFYQDSKERLVHWFLYPLLGIIGFSLQLKFNECSTILIYSLINLILIFILLLVTYIYFVLFLKKQFIDKSIGLGDIVMFISISFIFPTITFWILFTISLLFSLALYLILKSMKIQDKTVPLAGNMSLFFGFIYFVTFFIDEKILYIY